MLQILLSAAVVIGALSVKYRLETEIGTKTCFRPGPDLIACQMFTEGK